MISQIHLPLQTTATRPKEIEAAALGRTRCPDKALKLDGQSATAVSAVGVISSIMNRQCCGKLGNRERKAMREK